jgi:pimeloyl-ACP methyl ester carboxylesterase
MKWKGLAYQCLVYAGSWVHPKRYEGFMDSLRKKDITVDIGGAIRNDTVLVGHSLGGYFALRDAIRHQDKVAGVVLIHSHFNSRLRMPYPPVSQSEVGVPVLTILAGRDERLPFDRALDDILVCNQERPGDKFYKIMPEGTHFSGITDGDGREELAGHVASFLDAIRARDFTAYKKDPLYDRLRPRVTRLSDNVILTSSPMGALDAMLHITTPRWLWDATHWSWFLLSSPGSVHYMHEDGAHVFCKGHPDDIARLSDYAAEWCRPEETRVQTFSLPVIHPSILAWLSFPLFPFRDADNVIVIPVLVLHVKPNITYYKIPHPDRIYPMLSARSIMESIEK